LERAYWPEKAKVDFGKRLYGGIKWGKGEFDENCF